MLLANSINKDVPLKNAFNVARNRRKPSSVLYIVRRGVGINCCTMVKLYDTDLRLVIRVYNNH